MSRRYMTMSYGQVHVTENGRRDWRPPLYCLHATAYSGQTFLPLMIELAGRRRVVAPDTPGYGGSDRPDRPWDMTGYAEALAALIVAAEVGPIDILGYHTGAFIATELAVIRPDLVRRLVLIGVPFYRGADRAERRATLARRTTLTDDVAQFAERWDFFVKNRPAQQPIERGFANFVDELRAYPHGWWAHDAAFTYPAEARLGRIEHPVLILNPENHLAAPSREAASLIRECEIVELPHLSHAIFDLAGPEIAAVLNNYLESDRPARSPARSRAS